MMRLRFPLRHELLPNADGKWQIGQSAAVQVSELPPPETKLHATEAVYSRRDPGPR